MLFTWNPSPLQSSKFSFEYLLPEACLFHSPQPAARVRPLPDLWSLRCAFRRIAPYDPFGSGSGLTTNWVNRSGPRDSILPSEFSCSPRPTARYRSSRPLYICANLGVVVGIREVRLAAASRARFLWRLSGLADRTLHRLRRQSLIACGSQDPHSVPAVKVHSACGLNDTHWLAANGLSQTFA